MALDTNILEPIASFIGSLVAIVTTLVPLFFRHSRARLRTDIEILNLIQKNPDYREDKVYKKVKENLDKRILEVYSESKLSGLLRSGYILLGLLLIVLFGYVTLRLYFPEFSWWSILTGYFSVTGIVFILAGIYGRGKVFEELKLIPKSG